MCDRDEEDNLQNCVVEQCDLAMRKLRQENPEYDAAIRRQVALSMKLKEMLEDEDACFSEKKRDIIRNYMDALLGTVNMDECIACYKQGFADALRIVIETGALPDQR